MLVIAATTVLFALLFAATVFYCFQQRRISRRPGSFYLLIAAVGCSAAMASIASVEGVRFVHSLTSEHNESAEKVLTAIAGNPVSSRVIRNRAPQFQKPSGTSKKAWELWRDQLRYYLAHEIYELDFSTPSHPEPGKWLRRESRDAGLTRREFAIPAVDGDIIPAVLLLRADVEGPVPGILFVPGHVRDDGSGLAQLVLPITSYQKSAARELALAGYATLTIELRGFGLRGPPAFPDHFAVAYNAMLAGSFYKKLAFSDLKRALDFLQAVPEVDPERIGMSGASLGGELAVEYSGIDLRVKAVSFHAHGGHTGRFRGYTESGGKPLHYCHLVPGMVGILRREDAFLMLAPRPTQGIKGVEQPFEHDFVTSLTQLWSLTGNATGLELRSEVGAARYKGHAYFVDRAIRFFDQNL